MNKQKLLKNLIATLAILLLALTHSYAQMIVAGTVFDSSKLYVVPNVQVFSTSGNMGFTDSLGNYKIAAFENDSVSFYYNGRFTVKFPIAKMKDYQAFDISLRVRVDDKYKLLRGVTVFSNSYKKDSLENREAYAKVFGSTKPGLRSTYDPGGPAGLDIGELVGVFQFRKNKQRMAFQDRLLTEEEDRYVDFRFSAKNIERITSLKSPELEEYQKLYRPSYYFVSNSTLTQFYEYILNTSYVFKRENNIK
ncbi:MAG: hypothetical protein ABIW47_14325 [Ginsengibacter sp.]